MKIRLLITGATGFTGSHLIPALLKNPHYELIVVKRKDSDVSVIKNVSKKLRIYNIDPSYDLIYSIMKKERPDIVIHLAAAYPRIETKKDIETMLNSNIVFGTKLLNAMALNNVKRFLNTGSSLEYFNGPPEYNPATFYSTTKRVFQDIVEYYVRTYNFKAVTLLPYNTYGPNDKRNNFFSLLKDSLLEQTKLELTPGEQFIDLLFIEDLVNVYLKTTQYLLRKKNIEHEKFFIGSGKAVKLKEIVNMYNKISRKNISVVFGAIPYRRREIMFAQANIKEATKKLKWKPKVSLYEGIRRTLKQDKIIK